MEQSLRWDTDDDGVIDNSGSADQTYDAWAVKGARYNTIQPCMVENISTQLGISHNSKY